MKTIKESKKELTEAQQKIADLEKEIGELRSKSQIATLEKEIEELKKEKVNSQPSKIQAMTDLPGYNDEFTRLKVDAINQIKSNKNKKIVTSLGSIVSIPIAGVIFYFILLYTKFIEFLEFDPTFTQYIYIGVVAFFVLIELQAIFDFIKTLMIDPEVLPVETLNYIALTTKEHLLDPKGSVIREKYGTEKWTAVTKT